MKRGWKKKERMILKRKWNELSSLIKEKMGKRSWGARGSLTGIKLG